MLRVTLRNLLQRKLRLVLTALSIVLGVAFVAGTFVLTDSIKVTFDALVSQGNKNVDVVVRGIEGVSGTDTGNGRAPVSIALSEPLRPVVGVAKVTPDLSGPAALFAKDGTVTSNGGGPKLGFAAAADDDTFAVIEGRLPMNAGEVAVERATLERSGWSVGDETSVVAGPGRTPVRIVGSVKFGDDAILLGATVVLFDSGTAQKYFAPDNTVGSLNVRATPGVSQSDLRASIAAILPPGVEAITGAQAAQENRDEADGVLKFINRILLIFAGIALFVGSFIIVNTFTMLIAQRTRELALLRALGASRGQVTRSVLLEALLVGVVAATLGLLTGLGLARLFIWLLGRAGLEVGGDLPVAARTVVVAYVVGILVTVVAAYLPARRASRIPPLAAMRDDTGSADNETDAFVDADGTKARVRLRLGGRTTSGLVITALGVAGLLTALFADLPGALGVIGLSAAVLFAGVTLLAPLIAAPVVRFLAKPYPRLFATVGVLARENALRNPRRTATTAASLMIALALVSGVTVLAASVRATASGVLDRNLNSQFVVSGAGGIPIPLEFADRVRSLPSVASVAALSGVSVKAGDFETYALAVSAADIAANVDIDFDDGGLAGFEQNTVLVDRATAKEQGFTVGQVLKLDVGYLPAYPVTIGGIYAPNQALGFAQAGGLVLDRKLYELGVPQGQRGDFALAVLLQQGADQAAVRAGLVKLGSTYAVVDVADKKEFIEAQSAQINRALYIIYGLLGLAVLIAVLGIINTLALSVFERTREIGLLRAIGLDRRRLRRVIRLESVLIAVYGAVLGTALGIVFAVAVQRASRDEIPELSIPVFELALFLVFAGVVGVLAAWWPARRAAKLDVLRAVTAE